MFPTAEQRDLILKAQEEILAQVLPVIQAAADHVTLFITDSEDDEEIAAYMREVATEAVVDELVKVLTRDPNAVSKIYTAQDADDRPIDSLIACYNELEPLRARRWYAQQMAVSPEERNRMVEALPAQLQL